MNQHKKVIGIIGAGPHFANMERLFLAGRAGKAHVVFMNLEKECSPDHLNEILEDHKRMKITPNPIFDEPLIIHESGHRFIKKKTKKVVWRKGKRREI